MNREKVQKYLRTNQFQPSKKFGQNFLINHEIQRRIALTQPIPPDALICEIGPGLGAITKHLLQNYPNEYLAVEIDQRLAAELQSQYQTKPNFHLINVDFLKLDLQNELLNLKLKHYQKVFLIANLPYAVTSPIFRKIAQETTITECVLMVQKEFAERICAKPRTKAYNAISVIFQLIYTTTFLFNVAPEHFLPKPKVMSSVIHLSRSRSISQDLEKFLNLCFSQKRKTLVNNLQPKFTKEQVLACLKQLGYSPTVRAEEFTPTELEQLWEMLL